VRRGFGLPISNSPGSFEIAADHLIHVHEEAERFGHEIILAEHDPRDGGLIALRLEGELRRRGRSERLMNSSCIRIRSLYGSR